MAEPRTLHCSLITPQEQVIECDATSVALPAHDGQMGFLHNRAPLLCKLGVGELRIGSTAGEHRYFIDGGFAQMLNNELTVLTEHAKPASDIDAARANEQLLEAAGLESGDAASREKKDLALARARSRKRITSAVR